MLGEIHHVLDLNQCGFQLYKETGHSSHLTQCVIQWCAQHDQKGILIFADQSKAYDRVSHSFMRKVLTTMRFPPDFVNLTGLLYTNNEIRLSVNGHLGRTIRPKNGLKQGDGLSCPLYLCVFQTYLSLINTAEDSYMGLKVPAEHPRPIPNQPPLSTPAWNHSSITAISMATSERASATLTVGSGKNVPLK